MKTHETKNWSELAMILTARLRLQYICKGVRRFSRAEQKRKKSQKRHDKRLPAKDPRKTGDHRHAILRDQKERNNAQQGRKGGSQYLERIRKGHCLHWQALDADPFQNEGQNVCCAIPKGRRIDRAPQSSNYQRRDHKGAEENTREQPIPCKVWSCRGHANDPVSAERKGKDADRRL